MLLLEYKKIKSISNNLIDFLLDNDLECIIDDLKHSKDSKNYFDLSNDDKSKISYLKGDRIPSDENLIYDIDYRSKKAYHCKIGKLLSDKIDQSIIQAVSKLLYARSNQFKMIISDDICKYYHEDNYSQDHGINGQLHNSCMRYDHLQDAIKLYEIIGNKKVQLLVALDHNDLVIGRSLLWHDVNYKDDKIDYLDRVYASNDNIHQLFTDYADQNNFITRENKNNDVSVEIDYIDEDQALPYCDTFSYYNTCDSVLSSCDGNISLDNTEGQSINDVNSRSCYDCNNHYHEDELYYCDNDGNYYCRNCCICIDDYVYPIDECIQIGDTWYYKQSDDIVYSEYHQEYLLSDNAIYIDSENDYFDSDSDDIIYSDYYNQYLLKENAVYSEHHQDYFYQDDLVYSNIHDDYLKTDDDSIAFSKFHNDYIIIDHDDIVYIKAFDDYFDIDNECIYFDDQDQEYKHKQYLLVLV